MISPSAPLLRSGAGMVWIAFTLVLAPALSAVMGTAAPRGAPGTAAGLPLSKKLKGLKALKEFGTQEKADCCGCWWCCWCTTGLLLTPFWPIWLKCLGGGGGSFLVFLLLASTLMLLLWENLIALASCLLLLLLLLCTGCLWWCWCWWCWGWCCLKWVW